MWSKPTLYGPFRFRGRGSAWIAVAALTLLLPACGGSKNGRDLRGAARGLNLLLVTLDSTRGDRLGCYGYERARTPVIDSLAAAGVRFDRAYSPVPLTLPSHATLLTGTQPPEHGLRVNGRQRLSPEVTTLAEVFHAASYRTYAVVAAEVLSSKFGLDAGFETYDDSIWRSARPDKQIPADRVASRFLSWLEENGSRSFFAWIHFFDPHRPYVAREEWGESPRDRYDGEVAFVDQQIGIILRAMRNWNLTDSTLIVVTADHGESLGDHGEQHHGHFIYDSTQRVPLILTLPRSHAIRGEVDATIPLADLAPTLLALLGLPTPESMSGADFLTALEGGETPDRAVYLETENPRVNYGWAGLRGLTSGRWLFIDAPRPELYDREDDPGLNRNLVTTRPEVAGMMRKELAGLLEAMISRAGGDVSLDRKAIDALRNLGYVVGDPASVPDGEALADPKDRVEVLRLFETGSEAMLAGRMQEAISDLKAAAELAPRSPWIRQQLANCYSAIGWHEEAEREFAGAMEIEPDYTPVRIGRAQELTSLDRLPEAEAVYRGTLEQNSEEWRASLGLAAILNQQARFAESKAVLEAALEKSPNDHRLLTQLAWLLSTCRDEAIRDGERAQGLARLATRVTERQEPRALASLAAALAESGKFKEAFREQTRAYNQAIRLRQNQLVPLYSQILESYRAQKPHREIERGRPKKPKSG